MAPVSSFIYPINVPLVTALPSTASIGDQRIYQADATNGVYWHLVYDGVGTYPWKFIGGSGLQNYVTTAQALSVQNVFADPATVGPNITVPLAGSYDITATAGMFNVFAGANRGYVGVGIGAYAFGSELSRQAEDIAAQNHFASATVAVRGTLAASNEVRMRYLQVNNGVQFYARNLLVTPIRVSA